MSRMSPYPGPTHWTVVGRGQGQSVLVTTSYPQLFNGSDPKTVGRTPTVDLSPLCFPALYSVLVGPIVTTPPLLFSGDSRPLPQFHATLLWINGLPALLSQEGGFWAKSSLRPLPRWPVSTWPHPKWSPGGGKPNGFQGHPLQQSRSIQKGRGRLDGRDFWCQPQSADPLTFCRGWGQDQTPPLQWYWSEPLWGAVQLGTATYRPEMGLVGTESACPALQHLHHLCPRQQLQVGRRLCDKVIVTLGSMGWILFQGGVGGICVLIISSWTLCTAKDSLMRPQAFQQWLVVRAVNCKLCRSTVSTTSVELHGTIIESYSNIILSNLLVYCHLWPYDIFNLNRADFNVDVASTAVSFVYLLYFF